jgi:uncharacterized protein
MFREMRRKGQQLSDAETIGILLSCTSGVLAVSGDDDYPYAVPLSFAYREGKLLLHCAYAGHKIESITKHNKVSFCVIERDQVVPEEFTTYYRSVIVFGRARILTEDSEKKDALAYLLAKYSPDHMAARLAGVERELPGVCVVEITVEHMTGKAADELINVTPD